MPPRGIYSDVILPITTFTYAGRHSMTCMYRGITHKQICPHHSMCTRAYSCLLPASARAAICTLRAQEVAALLAFGHAEAAAAARNVGVPMGQSKT